MSLGTAIKAVCAANAPLTALVGARVWAVEAKQGETMPYIVWQKISAEPLASMREQNSEADSFNRVQFTVVGSTFESVEEVSAALVAAIDNTAVLTGHPANYEDERDLPSDDPGMYARAVDFSL